MQKHGGPRQWLMAELPTRLAQEAFYSWLDSTFPKLDSVSYCESALIPTGGDLEHQSLQVLGLRLSAFTFEEPSG